MNVENPALIASMEMLWLRENGTEVSVQVSTGLPYEDQGAWACPAALTGVDNRYPEVVGSSSRQAIRLAIRLLRQRLGHLLEPGAVLVDLDERDSRWDIDSLNAVFGRA